MDVVLHLHKLNLHVLELIMILTHCPNTTCWQSISSWKWLCT